MDKASEFLIKDQRWEGWQDTSLEYFQSIIKAFTFQHEVPQTIVKQFAIVCKLILHSYFEYEFLDVALERALFIFELALKTRYEEIHSRKPTRKESGLFQLIAWANRQGLFEDDEKIVHALRELRNEMAHPNKDILFGYLSLHIMQRIVEIINELYENVDMRRSRHHEEKKVNELLDHFRQSGAELDLEDIRIIIFEARLLYFNNIVSPPKYHFLFWPIFDPTLHNNAVNISEPIVICSKGWIFADSVFRIKNIITEQDVVLKHMTKNANIQKFENWKHDVALSTLPVKYLIDFQIARIKANIRSEEGSPGRS